MRDRPLCVVATLVAAHESAQAADNLPPSIGKLLTDIRAADKGQLAVSEEDGRFLRLLIASTGAKRVLEIGAASGYSAIWMGLGLRQTGGQLTTIEYDAVRAKEAAENVRRAGLQDVVTVVSGDAFKEIPKLQGNFDLVFLDAWKPDYKKFFDLVFPARVPGRPVPRAQRHQQEKRDGRLPRLRLTSHPSGIHDDGVAGTRRHFDDLQNASVTQ